MEKLERKLLIAILSVILLGVCWSIYNTSTIGNDSEFIKFADEFEVD